MSIPSRNIDLQTQTLKGGQFQKKITLSKKFENPTECLSFGKSQTHFAHHSEGASVQPCDAGRDHCKWWPYRPVLSMHSKSLIHTLVSLNVKPTCSMVYLELHFLPYKNSFVHHLDGKDLVQIRMRLLCFISSTSCRFQQLGISEFLPLSLKFDGHLNSSWPSCSTSSGSKSLPSEFAKCNLEFLIISKHKQCLSNIQLIVWRSSESMFSNLFRNEWVNGPAEW